MANKGNPLTNLGGQFADMVNTKRAAEAEAARMAEYKRLSSEFAKTQDPSLIPQIQEVAPEKFEGWSKAQEAMGDAQSKTLATSNAELMAAHASGDDNLGFRLASEKAEAAKNSGDSEQAAYYLKMANNFKEGRGEDIVSGLMLLNSTSEYGRDANDSYLKYKQELRDTVASEGKLFEIIQKNPWNSEADKKAYADHMEGMSLPTAKILGELASVISVSGASSLTADQRRTGEMALRKEYDTYVSEFVKMGNSATQIKRLASEGTGFSDQGMIMLFNKVLDPPSVVRESEAAMTAENQSVVNKGRTILGNLKEGDRLSDTARNELLAAVDAMAQLGTDQIAGEKDRITKSVDYFFGEDARERIFLEEKEEVKDPLADARAMLLKKYPDYEDIITNGTPEELQEAFKTTLEADGIDLIGTPATATTEDPVTSGTPFQEFVIKRNKLTGRAADNVRNMSDERLMEGNPGTASAWKAQQDAPAETELAPKIPDQPIQAEIRSKILNKARLQGNAGTQMYKDIQTMSIQELEKKYPELYKEFSTPADVWEF